MELRQIFAICEDFPRRWTISRPAPRSSLALKYDAKRKKILDAYQFAMYNIVMKLRNRIQRFKVRHKLYSANDIWQRYNIIITMVVFWVVVLTLIALEENGVI